MRAAARIVARAPASEERTERAAASRRGPTRLTVLYGEPPLLPRRTVSASTDDRVEVHLVGGAAGPLGGDDLRLDIDVGPGAHLVVRTVAASIVLPGPTGASSRLHVEAVVADGGRLEWLPEPLVAVRGCRHLSSSRVELHGSARLVWREELIGGRHNEDSGQITVDTAVRLDGAPLFRQDLTIGPAAIGWQGPAILGGARAVGCLLVVDPTNDSATFDDLVRSTPSSQSGNDANVARMRLAGPAVLTSAVAPDAHTLRRALDPAVGREPAVRY